MARVHCISTGVMFQNQRAATQFSPDHGKTPFSADVDWFISQCNTEKLLRGAGTSGDVLKKYLNICASTNPAKLWPHKCCCALAKEAGKVTSGTKSKDQKWFNFVVVADVAAVINNNDKKN